MTAAQGRRRCDGSNGLPVPVLYLPTKGRCSLLEFVLTVLVLELTPGPNMAYLATLALDRGRRAGLLATAGVAAGLSVHAIVAALGLGVLISQSPLLYHLLRWVGVAYLLYLAWETWQTSAGQRAELADIAFAFLLARERELDGLRQVG